MALVLKSTKTYIDRSAIEHSYVYGVIDTISFEKRRKRYAFIFLDIYKDEVSSNDNNIKPIAKYSFNVSGEVYFTYFAKTVLNELGKNIWKQGYNYILSLSDDDAGFNISDFEKD